jgi:glycosyltransferase involved in cell wall biosynthesis
MTACKRPMICWPVIDWNYLWHRPQQLMMRLAQAGHPVHVCNPNQSPGSAPETVAPNLLVYRDYGKLDAAVAAQAIYFIYFPACVKYLPRCEEIFIVYDCIDDDPAFDGAEALMLARADLVLCVSPSLIAKHRGKHRNLVWLPNGVDLEHYTQECAKPPLADLKTTVNPIIGFSGACYHEWVDIELIYDMAIAKPDWWLVIVGNAYRWDFAKAPPNVIYLGFRPYEVLPQYIKAFDVGLIPFRDNRIARGADPVKLYEYLAAGVPVVSRDLPFVRELGPPLVYRYTNVAECLGAIEQAWHDQQRLGEGAVHRRRDYVRQFTWDQQVGRLLQELKLRTCLEGNFNS